MTITNLVVLFNLPAGGETFVVVFLDSGGSMAPKAKI